MENPRVNVMLREEIAKHINKIVVEAVLHGGDDGPYYSNTKDLYNEMKDFQIKFLGANYNVEIISEIPVFVRNKNSIDPIFEPYDKFIEAHKKLLKDKGIFNYTEERNEI